MNLLFSAIFALEVASKLFNAIVDNPAQNATAPMGHQNNLTVATMGLKNNGLKMRQKTGMSHFQDLKSTEGDGSPSHEDNDLKMASLFDVLPQFEVIQSTFIRLYLPFFKI